MIQRSNAEQVQAIATRNLSLTADTLTADHFQELTELVKGLAGIVSSELAIHLK